MSVEKEKRKEEKGKGKERILSHEYWTSRFHGHHKELAIAYHTERETMKRKREEREE